jgi:hypothetical protein
VKGFGYDYQKPFIVGYGLPYQEL